MPVFLSYPELNDRHAIVVDGIHPRGLMLSHWKGATVPEDCEDDTSAGIVLNAIRNAIPGLDNPYITATHFDIDGFIGVWALLNKDKALKFETLLKEIALIGDFREIREGYSQSDTALKIVCWINAEEKAKFYAPFESEDEMEDCAPKFDHFLKVFDAVLGNVDDFREVWEPEYQKVKQDQELLRSQGKVLLQPALGLAIVQVSEPLHYYALFSPSKGTDAVVSVYDHNRYELELKYTTWVNIHSRNSFPRIHLEPLAAQLNSIENSGYEWFADKITDTGPILRLENKNLSKAARFADPYQREIFSSSIPPEEFISIVTAYFTKRLGNIKPQKGWSWNETRAVNDTLF